MHIRFVVARTLMIALFLFAALVGGFAAPSPGAAQDLEPDINFGDLTATPSFPEEIAFDFSAQSSEEIERVELLFNAVGEETLHLITAEEPPEAELDFAFGLNMYQNYYPPGLDLEYRWRVTTATGEVAESDRQLVSWYDTRFEWTSISSEQVTLYTYDTSESFAEELLASAQGTIDELETDYGVERSLPLRVWVYDSQSDLGGATEPNSEPWIAGVSYPGRYLVLAAVPDGNSMELRRVIPHEVSHQVLYQATENPFNFPATWLDEGMATYSQDVGTADFLVLVDEAAANGTLMPIDTMNMSFPSDDSYRLAYAQSYSIVSFIIATWGEDALGEIFNAYQDVVTHEEAVQRGIGISIDELDRQWRASLGVADGESGQSGSGGGAISTTGTDWINGILALVILVSVPLLTLRWWRMRGDHTADDGDDGGPMPLVRVAR